MLKRLKVHSRQNDEKYPGNTRQIRQCARGDVVVIVFPEIIHGTDQTGVVLEGGGFDFQPLRESGHDRLAHLRGQRIDQKLLLGADTAANQNQLRLKMCTSPPGPAQSR